MASWIRRTRWKVRTGLIGGVAILLLVDIIWVGSAGLTRYLFTMESYEKPFFTTYFKTSLFSIYLVAFLFWRPWQRQCGREVCRCGTEREAAAATAVVRDSAAPQQPTAGEDQQNAAPTQHREDQQAINSRAQDNNSGILTSARTCSTVCADFPPADRGVNKMENMQQCPCTSTASLNHPTANTAELCITAAAISPPTTTYQATNNGIMSCRQSQQHNQQTSDDDGGDSTGGVPPSAERNLEGSSEEEGLSETTKLMAPQSATNVPFGVVQRRVFDVSGSVNRAVCPIRPKLDVCMLGPPEFEPLGCYESDGERDTSLSTTLPPCRGRCCKVRFSTTIEVRERQGGDCQQLHGAAQRDGESGPIKPLSVWKVMGVAFIFGILWFFANYLYGLGLDRTTVAAVNTISAVSGVFVMVLAALPILNVTEGDKFTLSRLVVTLLSVGGIVMVSLSPSGIEDSDRKFNYGALYTLGGAALYALYLVLLKKVVQHHEALDIPMFFGFVGLFDFLLLLPLLLIWDVVGIEKFELPPTPNVWTLLLVNGFIGTVLSELLWLWAVFLTSPLLGTLALSLVTPLSIAYSIVVGKASFSWLFFCGAVLIIVAFVGVTVLDHFGAWDPLWVAIKKLFLMAKDVRQHKGFSSLSPESQRLISSQQSHCDHDHLAFS